MPKGYGVAWTRGRPCRWHIHLAYPTEPLLEEADAAGGHVAAKVACRAVTAIPTDMGRVVDMVKETRFVIGVALVDDHTSLRRIAL